MLTITHATNSKAVSKTCFFYFVNVFTLTGLVTAHHSQHRSIHPSIRRFISDIIMSTEKHTNTHKTHNRMNKGGNTHAAPYITFTALNYWTVLLLDITHWLANSTRELCTTASADGSDRSIRIPDILSRLTIPKFFKYIYCTQI